MGYVGFSCDAFIGNKGGGVIIANTKLKLCPIFRLKVFSECSEEPKF